MAPFGRFALPRNVPIDPHSDFPDSLWKLDFSHLLPKRVGHASRPSSRGGHFDAPIPERSSKLTTPRKNLSDAPLGPALVHTSFGHPYPAPRVRWALPGGKETFCGLPVRTDPKKGLRSTMEPSTYAVCQAAKWLKSSSRDCLEIPNGHRFGFLRACPMGRKGASRQRFALPNPRRPIPPAIFQTVSLARL